MSSKVRTKEASAPQSGTSQLGDLSFDDWYQTPVFEAEPDERLEQLATSRRAPLRLVAGAMLRLSPHRPQRSMDSGAQGHAPVETAAPAGAAAARPEAARPEAAPPAGGSWRDRTGRFLDRWAALETASQDRLESLVLPKRWRG